MTISQHYISVKNYRLNLLSLILLISACMSANAQVFSTTYNPGFFYTLDNVKHPGLIALNPDPPLRFKAHPDNILYFKQNKDADKQTVLMSTLKGFVIHKGDSTAADTFAIVHNNKNSRIKFKNDFAEVLYRKGPVNLYDYQLGRRGGILLALSTLYVDHYYYYGTDADTAVEMDNKDFIKVMSEILADDPVIVSKISQKEYKMGDMKKMLKEYYSRHAF